MMSDKNTLAHINKKIGIKLNILIIMYEHTTEIDKQNVENP